MERLTQRLRTGEVLMASDYEEKYTEKEWICVLQDRLAAYEDTELTPEEVSELIKDWISFCMTIRKCGGIDRLAGTSGAALRAALSLPLKAVGINLPKNTARNAGPRWMEGIVDG